ncbi:putative Membrane protein, partial [Pseudomonas amygdali pv. myricae]
ASALALLGLGWWLRLRNGPYALMLQGAGVGVLYLTVFAAMKLHALLDPAAGFVLLVAITAFSAILALTQNALALACAGALGGFAAPLLASTGQGSHISLFSYFALLNAGIIAIAWFKAWRILNLIGFFGTFGIGFAWGIRAYTPELFWSTEPFLILFFVMYLAIGLLFARRKLLELTDAPPDASRETLLRWSARQGDYVDGTLLFGTPIVGFGLQYALVEHLEFGAALSALALGLIYMGLARWLAARANGRTVLLMETCLALGVVFATLAIPLGLGSQWTTCAWAVEGAAVFWLGLRQHRKLAQVFGLVLQVCASAMLISDSDNSSWAGDYWTPMILAIAALISAWSVFRFNTLTIVDQKIARTVLKIWGAIWWAASLISVVQLYAPNSVQTPLLLIAAALSLAIWAVLAL